jgi:lipopolysaccharide biosynthesis glycosyltransferase
MNIIYVSDINYVEPLLLSIGSLINSNDVEKIDKVYIFIDFNKLEIVSKIKKLLPRNKFEVIEIHDEWIDNLKEELESTISKHASIANYYRLFISQYLPEDIRKAIYLDCDTIVLGEIYSFYELNIENYLFGAVQDSVPENRFYKNQFQLNDDLYFNSGVLLMNIELIRKLNFVNSCITFIKNSFSKITYWDQDVINIVASGKIMEIGYQYNYQSDLFSLKTLHKPVIIHYTGEGISKPWNNKYNALKIDIFHDYYWKEYFRQNSNRLSTWVEYYLFWIKYFSKKIFKSSIKSIYGKFIKILYKVRVLEDIANTSKNYIFNENLLNSIGVIKNSKNNYEVSSGPFEGLKYTELNSFGSSIVPKIFGIYEREIHHVLYDILKNDYSLIIDIGSAEGYYLIGFALQFPKAELIGVDTDNSAIEFCKQMIVANNIPNRIKLINNIDHSFFENKKLLSSKALIFCDCEGYENKLFSIFNMPNLKNVDILVEIHDFIDKTIGDKIFSIFYKSHDIKIFNSESDNQRIQEFIIEYPFLNYFQLKALISENRPNIMQWFWIKSKNI